MSVTYALTVFNKAAFLLPVLEAVCEERASTGGEIIVVDDCSTDESPAILARYESRGLRIIRFTENRGVMAATAALIDAARQPWLRLVDGDDRILPGSTAALISVLSDSDAVLAFGQAKSATGNVLIAAARVERLVRPVRAMLERQNFNPSMTLIPTARAKALIPLPVEIRTAQDFWLGLQLALAGDFLACPFEAAVIAADAGGLSRRKARVFADTLRLTALALPQLGPADAAFALKRQAGRAVRYFRREAPDCLTAAERWRLRAAAWGWPGGPQTAADLERIAGLYERGERQTAPPSR